MFPWKQPEARIPLAVRQIRSFLRAHRPASAQAAPDRRTAGQRAAGQNRNSRANLAMNARYSSIGSLPGRSVVSRWSL